MNKELKETLEYVDNKFGPAIFLGSLAFTLFFSTFLFVCGINFLNWLSYKEVQNCYNNCVEQHSFEECSKICE